MWNNLKVFLDISDVSQARVGNQFTYFFGILQHRVHHGVVMIHPVAEGQPSVTRFDLKSSSGAITSKVVQGRIGTYANQLVLLG
jgi:hypothetical protein